MSAEDGLCVICRGTGRMNWDGGQVTCDECGGCGHYWDPDWPIYADDGWWFECPACRHEAPPAETVTA